MDFLFFSLISSLVRQPGNNVMAIFFFPFDPLIVHSGFDFI